MGDGGPPIGQQAAPGLSPQAVQGEFCKGSHWGGLIDNALLLKAVGANGYVLTFPMGDGIPLSGNFCRPRPLLSYQFAYAYRIFRVIFTKDFKAMASDLMTQSFIHSLPILGI